MNKTEFQVKHLGLIGFKEAEIIQRETAELIASDNHPNTLYLLEHPHTYSFGRQGNKSNLLWDQEQLAAKEITTVWTDRGGDVTYHGPGQLVGYPIFKLGEPGRIDVKAFLRKLERVLIKTLDRLGIQGIQIAGQTGVWVPSCQDDGLAAKIASIGLKIDANGISRHGFALNVCPDMRYWDGIRACGLENQRKTSIQMLHPDQIDIAEIRNLIQDTLSCVYNRKILS